MAGIEIKDEGFWEGLKEWDVICMCKRGCRKSGGRGLRIDYQEDIDRKGRRREERIEMEGR